MHHRARGLRRALGPAHRAAPDGGPLARARAAAAGERLGRRLRERRRCSDPAPPAQRTILHDGWIQLVVFTVSYNSLYDISCTFERIVLFVRFFIYDIVYWHYFFFNNYTTYRKI